ncbi:MAG: OmpA family protein [Spirosomataceae bacterium]
MKLFNDYEAIFTEDRLETIKKIVGSEAGDVDKAIKGIYYTLIAGLIRRSNSNMGANLLYSQVVGGIQDTPFIDNFDAILADKRLLDTVVEKGNKLISQVFPAFKSPLVSTIGSYAGANKVCSTVYIGLVTTSLVDSLAQIVTKENMEVTDLVYFMQTHHEALITTAPAGLMDKMVPALGLQDLLNYKFATTQPKKVRKEEIPPVATSYTTNADVQHSSNAGGVSIQTILAIGVAAVLVAAGAYWYQSQQSVALFEESSEEEVVEVMDDQAITPDQIDSMMTKEQAPVPNVVEEAAVQKVDVYPGLTSYVKDATQPAGKKFVLPEITFATKNDVEPSAESKEAIASIVETMKSNPTVQIKFEGFGKTKSEPKLAKKRAFALKRALLAAGIDNERIDADAGTTYKDKMSIVVIKK